MTADGRARRAERVVVATSNAAKLEELAVLLPASLQLVSLSDLALESPDETGQTFLDNAILKAEHASMMSELPAIADDSGLEVDALGGAPGVYSARYAGQPATDDENNRKLVRELALIPGAERTARFVCAVAFRAPDGFLWTTTGAVCGAIVDTPRGSSGFGYDPHFEIDDRDAEAFRGRTMAELSLDEKSLISHRSRAYRQLLNLALSAPTNHPALKLLLVT